jgi:hypothetical protein
MELNADSLPQIFRRSAVVAYTEPDSGHIIRGFNHISLRAGGPCNQSNGNR